MRTIGEILALFLIITVAVYAQKGEASSDSGEKRDSTKNKSEYIDEGEGYEDDGIIGSFLKALFGESGSEDESTSKRYDYFQDSDNDGVDDRWEKSSKNRGKTGSKKSSSSKKGSNKKKSAKPTRRRGK